MITYPCRINKYLAACGLCSRRGADTLIADGKVFINGKKAEAGENVLEGDIVTASGVLVSSSHEHVLLAFNKPIGCECTCNREIYGNLLSYIDYPGRVFPVGRLDKNSCGLILLTNDGDLAKEISGRESFVEKEYEVYVDKEISDEFLCKMAEGVEIDVPIRRKNSDGKYVQKNLHIKTRKCTVTKKNEQMFAIILTEGYNRQIRRMCAACGYEVTRLKRVRVGEYEIGNLEEGEWRKLKA